MKISNVSGTVKLSFNVDNGGSYDPYGPKCNVKLSGSQKLSEEIRRRIETDQPEVKFQYRSIVSAIKKLREFVRDMNGSGHDPSLLELKKMCEEMLK